MNKIYTLFAVCLLGFSAKKNYAQSFTPLYAGEYYSDEMDVIDTTGLTITIVESITVTSDFGSVDGIFGLSRHPISDEMYVCYESGSATARRIGTMDTETGEISDIANCGNIIDIAFGPDGSLYGSTGGYSPDYSLVQIDIVTGANTFILDYTPSSYGGGMAYNPFSEELYYQNNNGSATVDLDTYIETPGSPTGSPGETQAMVILSPDLGWIASYGLLYTFNPITEIYTSSISIADYHSFAFGQPSCTAIDITASDLEVCEGDEVTLTGTGVGAISWDMGVVNGVPFIPGDVGVYTYNASSDDGSDCPVSIDIEVLGLPTIVAGAGDLNYCDGEAVVLSASGDADAYIWNDGEELDLTPPVGSHTYTLSGSYVGTGCDATVTETVTITMHALPVITASADANPICIGNEVTLTGTGGETYTWDDIEVENGVAFSPNVIGTTTYNVTGTDENACSNTASIDLEVVDDIEITLTTSDELTGSDGEVNITVSGGAPTYSYDWDNDGTGDFDDSESLSGLTAGTYTVVVKGEAGCENTATGIVNSQLGIQELNGNIISLYPNPTTEMVTIDLKGSFTYELVTLSGDILINGTGTDKSFVSLKDYATGIYFVNIKSETNTTSIKVIKQ